MITNIAFAEISIMNWGNTFMKTLLDYRIQKFKNKYQWDPKNETITIDNSIIHMIIVGKPSGHEYLQWFVNQMKNIPHEEYNNAWEYHTKSNSRTVGISHLILQNPDSMDMLYEMGCCSSCVLIVHPVFFIEYPTFTWDVILYHELGHARLQFEEYWDKNSLFDVSITLHTKVIPRLNKLEKWYQHLDEPTCEQTFTLQKLRKIVSEVQENSTDLEEEIRSNYDRFILKLRKLLNGICADRIPFSKVEDIADEIVADCYSVVCCGYDSAMRCFHYMKTHVRKCRSTGYTVFDMRIDLLPLIVETVWFKKFKQAIEKRRSIQ